MSSKELTQQNETVVKPENLKDRLVWIDMEMTGLNVEESTILEVACVVTDGDLNVKAEMEVVINQSEEVLKSMNTWCVEQHFKSGLTQASLESNVSLKEAEEMLTSFLIRHTIKGVNPLAGNTVYMDKLFLSKYMPSALNQLHYRIVDVSSVKELCRRWYPQIYYSWGKQKTFKHREKAKKLCEHLDVLENFAYSSGWLHRFKGRFHILQRRLCGEGASISPAIIDEHLTNLNSILANSGYDPANIYNADETGLFFQLIPDRTLAHKDENCRDKQRLLIIGKSAKPRCFRNFSPHFYCTYTSNSKAWMTSNIFQEWLLQFNKQLVSEGRRILLLLDNATSHCIPNDGFSNIKIHFLPPNMTASLQPLDSGIIKSFKAQYRKLQLQKMVELADAHLPKELRLDNAVRYCKMAWDSVSPDSISNCWNHTGIIRFTSNAAVEPLNYGNLLDRIRDIFAITPENLMTEREFQLVDDSQEAEMKLTDDNFLLSTVTAKEELGEDDDATMTGLNVEESTILEVACVVTDGDLNVKAEMEVVINQSEEVLKSMNTWCVEQHFKSGLTQASLESNVSLKEAEEMLTSFLIRHTIKGVNPLAGNTVYMDKLFLSKYMPSALNQLHYRIVDVSSVKELCRRWYPQIYYSWGKQKTFKHRAMEDIKESIEELKYYRENLRAMAEVRSELLVSVLVQQGLGHLGEGTGEVLAGEQPAQGVQVGGEDGLAGRMEGVHGFHHLLHQVQILGGLTQSQDVLAEPVLHQLLLQLQSGIDNKRCSY
ncbi:hypothetical protein LAZ67_12003090 [Cordylochernes scorpioides]|uniref:HTH CENPB-type domain-containing protein n=1 Tax=Cordylochernes scorpioides TaxID=51811 RepID=A0ABY6L281_9ARAC|nr:hypothetical protein LAZ67_12003090 [Cordylochernes scorpioides]